MNEWEPIATASLAGRGMARGPLKPKMPKPRTHPTRMKSKVRTSMIIIYQHYFTWWFSKDVRVSRPPLFWSRSRSYSNWPWSRFRSHVVLVSVSYALVSWSQIDLVFLRCNDFCVLLILASDHDLLVKKSSITIDYLWFITSNILIHNKAYRFVLLSHAVELTRLVSVS